MKQLLLICAVVAGGCASAPKVIPNSPEAKAAIRKAAKKPTGELTKADLEKVPRLNLGGFVRGSPGQLTDVTGLEKLTQLRFLTLSDNQLTNVKGLEKLTQLKELYLQANQLTDVKDLEKLDQLERLYLEGNPALTKARIDQLQKALPKCDIRSNPTK